MRNKVAVLFGLLIFLSLAIIPIFSQKGLKAQGESECQKCKKCTSAQEGGGSLGSKLIFGDVVEVDLQNNQLRVNYLDEETGKRNEVIVGVDEETQYRNINSFKDIKVNDPIDIEYIIDSEGRVIASFITLVEELRRR